MFPKQNKMSSFDNIFQSAKSRSIKWNTCICCSLESAYNHFVIMSFTVKWTIGTWSLEYGPSHFFYTPGDFLF